MDIKMVSKLYKQNSLLTLPTGKLLLWLLDETIKVVKKGIQAMHAIDIAEQNRQIQIAQQIVVEIIPLINNSIDGGKKFMMLIDYINRRLIEANMNCDVLILEEVEQFLNELRSVWNEVI
ncbi:flagellar export chaperone FliS [Metabacillus bambusae]|uniref:Flagellar protein FliS n=1 Tax=Metabacillus bambusae TaxID=2795218 RepID=A0ABS3N0C5_9BACI|nr:flagellar export chaperone FliS [Metabacillus bambusae]MBO1511726.1 flagellar protein FliS [Metabacillus bambusae]